MRLIHLFAFGITVFAQGTAIAHEAPGGAAAEHGVQARFTVLDAQSKLPIELAHVVIRRNGKFVAQDATNPAGLIRFRDLEPGKYVTSAWFVGYDTFVDTLVIDETHSTFTIALRSSGTEEQEVVVTADREMAVSHIDLRTGNQVFESETYHPPPTARMTNLIQENLLGTARAPTGEVHVRGQHGEFTYYIDGLPVPLGVFGGLNEVVDPKVIDRATFITGGFPAEYGGQMAAIVDLNNRVPTGTFHLDASTYAGSYLVFNGTKPFTPGGGTTAASPGDSLGPRVGPFRALNSNGQQVSMSDHIGNLGYFVSGSRQETDRRIDPPVASLFHDHGFDYFLYGKFDYILSDVDYLTSNLNFGRTSTEVPFDSVEAVASDMQRTTNGFQTLSYFRTLNSEIDQESNLFVGAYAREGGLVFTPGLSDPPAFQFIGDTSQKYLLAEDRSFTTIGMRLTYDSRLSHGFMYKAGFNASSTAGDEDFTSRDSAGTSGPSMVTRFHGSDVGVFVETEWHPLDWASFELGLRYDQHIAPEVPLERQVSPRLRWNCFLDEANSAYLYYGRLFMPTNVEGLRSIALNVSSSVVPTVAERDDFYEAEYTHLFPGGFRSKLTAFFKHASPGLDDQTVGSSAIKTPVNISLVRVSGIECGFSFNSPHTPFSGYVNGSVIHAYGSGPVTGGFLDISSDGAATDLDHDQRLSIVSSINYQPRDWFVNVEGIYGSGLTNGNPGRASYQTGLFDFNSAAHVAPSWIINVGAGHLLHWGGGATFEPSLYVTNLLDHEHLIKGAYFSAASWEERRNLILRLAVHV